MKWPAIISVLICNTDSIKDNQIHEGDPDEAEYRFNSETYTPSAGVAGMLLHIYMENSQRENWNHLLLKRFDSSYKVDIAVFCILIFIATCV